MVDELGPVSGVGCEAVRDQMELLALDALEPADRDVVLAHVDGCAACGEELDRIVGTVGALLLLVPDVDGPDDLAERVVVGTVSDGAEGSGTPGRRRGVGRALGVAAAVVAVVLLLAALGSASRTVFGSDERADPQTATNTGARSAPLLTAAGEPAGSVVIDPAGPTLVMDVDAVAAGVSYECVVRAAAGDEVTVGSWTAVSDGGAMWSVALDPGLGAVDEVHLVGAGGTILATALLT